MRKPLTIPILLLTLLFPALAYGETKLSCKSTKTKDRVEIVIDRVAKMVVFFDIPAKSEKKFRIDFLIFHDGKMRGDIAGDIGAFSNHLDFFNTLTINKKNLNIKHLDYYTDQDKLEKKYEHIRNTPYYWGKVNRFGRLLGFKVIIMHQAMEINNYGTDKPLMIPQRPYVLTTHWCNQEGKRRIMGHRFF